MSNIPSDLKYAKSHEWLKLLGDGTALIGITDYAQSSLGDITFVQLPKVGAALRSGEAFGVVESVKAASDVYAPVACTVLEINAALDANPEKVNQSPYEGAWMLKVKVNDAGEAGKLLSAADYAAIAG
jgi:glycine cleavage system H protein